MLTAAAGDPRAAMASAEVEATDGTPQPTNGAVAPPERIARLENSVMPSPIATPSTSLRLCRLHAAPSGRGVGGRRTSQGFNVIELMIVLAIIAALSAMAWPSWRDAIVRGRRADALAGTSQWMQDQERRRSNADRYPQSWAAPGTQASPDGHYQITLGAVDAALCPGMTADAGNSYALSAAPTALGPQAGDSSCSRMEVHVCGGNAHYISFDTQGQRNAPERCWAR